MSRQEIAPPSPEQKFERQKQAFFTKLALGMKDALKMHASDGGLWDRNEAGERDFGNVTEHCLVEAARAEVLAEALGFTEEEKRNLMLGATLHDYLKKKEIGIFRAAKETDEAVLPQIDALNEESNARLADEGFSPEVITIKDSAGGYPGTLIQIKEILDQDDLSNLEISQLIMSYIDAYTNNHDWVEASFVSDGTSRNDVDRKRDRISSSAMYVKSEREAAQAFEGHPFFQGKSSAEALALVAHAIEERLAKLVRERSGTEIEPIQVPEFVDSELRKKIAAV